jgi:hypothetical protein
MIADVHRAAADGAVPVDDIEFQEREIRVFGPVMWHGVDFRVVGTASRSFSKLGKRIREKLGDF